MLGWEFPPYNVGGLGVACHGLAKGLIKKGNNLKVVLPKVPEAKSNSNTNLKLISTHHEEICENIDIPEKFKTIIINSLLTPYMSQEEYEKVVKISNKINQQTIQLQINKENNMLQSKFSVDSPYGENLYEEVIRYAYKVASLSKKEKFDIIHAHDWMTFPAGIVAKKTTGKPLVIHIHNTAFDRSGGNPNPQEYQIEQEGFHNADKIIAISHLVKKTLISKYNIPAAKISVVHNGIDPETYSYKPHRSKISKRDKVVLFAGRVTIQKGPEYFVQAAKKVCDKKENVKFVLAGNGDMYEKMICLAAELGIADKFIFTGKYSKEQGEKLMSMADVFVMPSVSEPFGLVPLEAMIQKTPTIISKQSGVSEVIANTLKVDFWDINQLSNKIIALLDYPSLHSQISEYGEKEVKNHTWDNSAEKCNQIFNNVIKKCNSTKATP